MVREHRDVLPDNSEVRLQSLSTCFRETYP